MKRSDMVSIIEYYGLPVEVLQKAGLDSLVIADNILKLIEEQGMLPPETEVNIADNGCEEEGYETVMQNRWEEV